MLFDDCGYRIDQYIPEIGGVLGDVLLTPHRNYVRPVMAVMQDYEIHAMAHLTGGGFYSNIPRMLPMDCQVSVERRYWGVPPIFGFIQERGGIEDVEMHRTFNMGIGMVLIVAREKAMEIQRRLTELGETASLIGDVHKGAREVTIL